MTETLNEYCKRTEQEKRELSQKIAQMECGVFQMEKVIANLEGKLQAREAGIELFKAENTSLREAYGFSQKCIKQLELEIIGMCMIFAGGNLNGSCDVMEDIEDCTG